MTPQIREQVYSTTTPVRTTRHPSPPPTIDPRTIIDLTTPPPEITIQPPEILLSESPPSQPVASTSRIGLMQTHYQCQRSPSSVKARCRKCGKRGHIKMNCRQYKCNNCDRYKPGHLTSRCPHYRYGTEYDWLDNGRYDDGWDPDGNLTGEH